MLGVMVVDKQRQMYAIYRNMLHWEQYGFEILTYCDSEAKAVEYFCEYRHDLVISDVREQYAHTVSAVEGAVEYVRNCRRQGKRMCVVTANDTPLTEMVLQRLGILEDMEFILSSEESGLTKRTPQMVLEAARRLQLDPSECVMLEDSLYSMKSAKQAGCYVIAVASADQADYAQICATADEVHEDLRTASIR